MRPEKNNHLTNDQSNTYNSKFYLFNKSTPSDFTLAQMQLFHSIKQQVTVILHIIVLIVNQNIGQ